MKLLINDKYEEVNVWSFMKCNFLSQLLLMAIIYGSLFLIGLIIGWAL